MEIDMMLDLAALGRDAVADVAGAEAVETVEVKFGLNSLDQPTYRFDVLFNPGKSRERLGLVLLRSTQALDKILQDRRDEHVPVIRLLSHEDWDLRQGG